MGWLKTQASRCEKRLDNCANWVRATRSMQAPEPGPMLPAPWAAPCAVWAKAAEEAGLLSSHHSPAAGSESSQSVAKAGQKRAEYKDTGVPHRIGASASSRPSTLLASRHGWTTPSPLVSSSALVSKQVAEKGTALDCVLRWLLIALQPAYRRKTVSEIHFA